ncbi:uncharacterized protein LOC101742918 [Bombyx mori]|uniref:COMM domain-containing protein 5 n=1 Tax=Bombyx mori TaxID=7091 RepID=A0A8R1WHV5_BOMMO|nr:uncharacterized protein LOC101742918 [Bombyx mori]
MSEHLEFISENISQWSAVSKVTPEIQKKEIRPFVILSLKELEGIEDERLSSLMNAEKFAAVRAIVRHFARLRSATKSLWGQDDVKTFLDGLRFSPECTSELSVLLCTEKLYENIPKHLRMKPGVVSLQWKIDVSLSQSTIETENPSPQRRKEIMHTLTHVIVTFVLTDGQIRTYRLSISQFHELRYVIASALKNMIILERRKCMKKE